MNGDLLRWPQSNKINLSTSKFLLALNWNLHLGSFTAFYTTKHKGHNVSFPSNYTSNWTPGPPLSCLLWVWICSLLFSFHRCAHCTPLFSTEMLLLSQLLCYGQPWTSRLQGPVFSAAAIPAIPNPPLGPFWAVWLLPSGEVWCTTHIKHDKEVWRTEICFLNVVFISHYSVLIPIVRLVNSNAVQSCSSAIGRIWLSSAWGFECSQVVFIRLSQQ